jgi:hypothetical protein
VKRKPLSPYEAIITINCAERTVSYRLEAETLANLRQQVIGLMSNLMPGLPGSTKARKDVP